jgi:hypothetical protein
MKYLLLFCGSAEDAAAFEALTPDELRTRYAQVGAWFSEHNARIGATGQLQGPQTATSVRFGLDGPPVVTDGPSEASQADQRPLGLTANPAERALLEQRLD